MKLRSCITSHFISAIEDNTVKKVHNTNSNGRPFIKLKKLKDVYQSADAMLQNDYTDTKSDCIGALNEPTNLPFADRKTKARNGYASDEDQPESSSNEEDSSYDLPLSQLKKKRKASESVATPLTDFDDSDLSQPLFKFKVKAPKTSSKKMSANESFPATVNIKVEIPEEDYYTECREGIASLLSNESVVLIASESGVIYVNNELKSKKSESLFTNEGEICGFNEASLDGLDDIKNMEFDNEENKSKVNNQSPSIVSSKEDEDDSPVEDLTTTTSDSCSQSQPTSEQVNHIFVVQDSVNADVDLNSDTIPVDTPIIQEQPSIVPANADSEVNFSAQNYETDIKNEASDCRKIERLPSTRKAISPTSQEKLCLAMKSEELLLDDMDRYKCKEKLFFEEKTPENKFSSNSSDAVCSEPNVHQQQVKAVMHKKQKIYKKGSPPKKHLPTKGCLNGPRLCRSLPRLSTGCTTVQGCSESAVAFSQRQMHDIESLASKLMSELNSMKTIVEEKLLFEAYRSTSLAKEADEVKSAIKSAIKTEESAKKWLSMMARDCNRFCTIMKQNEDPGKGMIEKKAPVEREKKKISFADEAGGTLCDIKVYEIEQTSLEPKQNN